MCDRLLILKCLLIAWYINKERFVNMNCFVVEANISDSDNIVCVDFSTKEARYSISDE